MTRELLYLLDLMHRGVIDKVKLHLRRVEDQWETIDVPACLLTDTPDGELAGCDDLGRYLYWREW